MPIYIIITLALIQGITEFLPISSSGHLQLAHTFLDPDASTETLKQNLLIDIAVHVGTLFSVLLYFHRDVLSMVLGVKDTVLLKTDNKSARLNIYVIISSIPVILVGFVMSISDFVWSNSVLIVAWMTLIFGIALWVVDSKKPQKKVLNSMNWKHALMIGLAQTFALIPGTSRSGVTMTMARYLGYSRTESARYSLLLAIIAIMGAGTLAGIKLIQIGDIAFTKDAVLAVILSFISGLIAIRLMMKWLERASFKIFAIYRILLGAALLSIAYSGAL